MTLRRAVRTFIRPWTDHGVTFKEWLHACDVLAEAIERDEARNKSVRGTPKESVRGTENLSAPVANCVCGHELARHIGACLVCACEHFYAPESAVPHGRIP